MPVTKIFQKGDYVYFNLTGYQFIGAVVLEVHFVETEDDIEIFYDLDLQIRAGHTVFKEVHSEFITDHNCYY